MFYGYGLGYYVVHVHDPNFIWIGKYIGVSKNEYKMHDVTMPTNNVIKYYQKKKSLHKFLTDPRPKDIFMSIIIEFYSIDRYSK